jgi:tetratricopeptide (TPR) repeat protein/ribonuclease BN (tRNA processing enzyme)
MAEKDILETFAKRFWEARRLQVRKHTEECLKVYAELAAWACANGIPKAVINAEAAALEAQGKHKEAQARLTKALDGSEAEPRGLALFILGSVLHGQKEYDEAIASYTRALEDPSFDRTGYAWNNMGLAYDDKGEHDKAIECYRKTLDDPSYDTPANIWTNMGNSYSKMADYEKALEYYRKALDDPSLDNPGQVWNNLGAAYSVTGNQDKAIECYRKALDDPSYDKPSYTWHNMGLAYGKKGEHGKAIKCYRKALAESSFDTPGTSWNNMGLAYRQKGDHKKAGECFHEAEKAYVKAGDGEGAARIRALLAALGVRAGERSERDQALLREAARAAPTGEKVAPSALERLRQRLVAAEQTAYEEYVGRGAKPQGEVLAILKGWGSAVPLIAGGEGACRGGGYFVSWGDKGVVIDPGFGFLSNFHAEGFHLRQVHGVIVSHNHPDHTHDLEAIDALFYEMSKQKDRHREKYHYVLVSDADTHDAHPQLFVQRADRTPAPRFDLGRVETGQETEVQLPPAAQLPFRVGYFRARHGDRVPNAVGLRLTCGGKDKKGPVIGFSCDTGFYDELCDNQHLGGCDLFVLHVSQPRLDELDDPKHLKHDHLGFRGVERLVKGCKPRLTIVCEFWAGLADLRIELLQALREECETDAILPGGVGLLVNLRTLEVRCTKCRKWTRQSEILVSGPQEPFGPPMYLCPHCRL